MTRPLSTSCRAVNHPAAIDPAWTRTPSAISPANTRYVCFTVFLRQSPGRTASARIDAGRSTPGAGVADRGLRVVLRDGREARWWQPRCTGQPTEGHEFHAHPAVHPRSGADQP